MTLKIWQLVAAVVVALLIGYAVGHYGFNSPPPVTQTDPHKQKAPGP